MKKNNIPKARKNNLVVQDLDGETLIYDLTANRAVCLNETSALVWQNCDGVKTVADIGSVLSAKTNKKADEDLIWLALDQLKKENLIENSAELEEKFAGVSRREVIKRVGLGTMIALPIVTGLVAPIAANAQSPGSGGATVGENGACTTTSQCIQNVPFGTTCCSVTGPGGARICRAAANGCNG